MISTLAMSVLLSLSACGEKKQVSPRGPVVANPAPNDGSDVTTCEGCDDETQAPKDGKKKPGDIHVQPTEDSEGTPKSRQLSPTNPSDDSLPLPPPVAPGTDNGPGLPPPPPGTPPASDVPAPVPQQPQPTPVPAPEQPPKLPPRPPTSATPRPPKPTPTPRQQTPPPPPAPPTQVPAPRPPVDRGDNSSMDEGYNSEDRRNVDQSRFNKTYTGLKDEDGLSYVGASADNLLNYLRKNSNDASVAAARNVISARLTRGNGQVQIVLELLEGNASRTYTLGGYVGQSRTNHLQVIQGNGARSVEGSLTCMDADGGCETSVGQFIIGDQRSRATVRIIFRDSLADVHAALPGRRSGNPEYERVRAFWLNSNDNENTNEKLSDVYFNAFEVVHGRSGFDIQVLSENRQMLVMAGPLLAPRNGTATNIRADRSAAIPDLNQYAYDISNTIGAIKIVNNNGLGQMRFQLKMRPAGDYEQDVFNLTVMRIVKPLRSFKDISL
ncbi:MAG: hypothetical protein EOP04_10130 [Proteobacteria bacterium]|nr:MAG: hypothetical protein EOP04_10130 [Pseudomonadota bacterium]